MQLIEGKVRVAGSVAYCELRPWILSTTIKVSLCLTFSYVRQFLTPFYFTNNDFPNILCFCQENILFGEKYDEVRFSRAIKATNLEDDIRSLPAGLLTEIGM